MKIQNAHGEACGGSLKSSFARLLQLRVRPAGRQGRRQAPRRDGRAVRLQPGRRARSARRARRSRRRTRSATTSRSARRRSARARCSPRRSSSPPWRRRSACAAAASRRRSRAAPRARRRAPPATRTARVIARFMRAVVTDGTGVGAAVPGVKVAGKTGTAELRSTVNEDPQPARARRRADAAARGGQDRHRRLVRRLRALRAPARGGRRAARRPGRGRRDGRAGGQDRHPGGSEGLGCRRRGRRCRRRSGPSGW